LYQFDLYFDPEGSYVSKLKQLITVLEELKLKWNADYEIFETGRLTSTEIEQLQSSIRSIPPQVRGRIVSSGNHILPFSRTKRLNLKNTPVILLKKNGIPVDVYPHLLGTSYSSPVDALSRILRVGPDEYREARGILEDPLIKILFDYPESLEKGMIPMGRNIVTDAGVIDALLRDGRDNPVVVELETRAQDSSIAQVCRLAAGYAKSTGTSLEKIRKLVVCLDYEGQLVTTCEGSDVELYKLAMRRVF
jgi:hypothetical protein